MSWTPGSGEPTVSNPAQDQVQVTFDACSAFAQRWVEYVLSDLPRLDPACLERVDSVDLPDSQLVAYRVVAAED